MKKSVLVLSVLVVSVALIPACGKKSKKNDLQSTEKKAEFAAVDIPLADDMNLEMAEGTESINSFFDGESEEGDQEVSQETMAVAVAPEAKDEAMEKVFFAFDSYEVDTKQRETIEKNGEKIVKTLEENPEKTCVVEGHACSSAGSATYNLALSEKRAKEVANSLVAAGVPQEKLKVVGRGKEVPAVIDGKPVTGSREEQWPNRRVEVAYLEAATAPAA